IADVSAAVAKDTPIDAYAGHETTTVYAGVKTFAMLPEELSTNLTSLSEGEARAAVVIEFIVRGDGCVTEHSVYPATVRNRARLTYSAMGPWLEGKGQWYPPADLQAQIRLQDEAAQALRQARDRMGALTF